jgi:hypothetical protein
VILIQVNFKPIRSYASMAILALVGNIYLTCCFKKNPQNKAKTKIRENGGMNSRQNQKGTWIVWIWNQIWPIPLEIV